MRRKPEQRQAIMDAGAGVFVIVSSARETAEEFAELLLMKRE